MAEPTLPASTSRAVCRGALCVVLALLLGACGDDEAPSPAGVRVRILTSAVDGPVQGRIQLRAIEEEGDRIYDCEPVEGEDDLHVARGAPPALYSVVSTEGWGMLWAGTGSPAPRLHGAGSPATLVRMGRPRTLYLGAADPRFWQVSASWGVEVKDAGAGDAAPFERVRGEIRMHPERLASVTLAPEHWKAGQLVRFVGRMESGVPTRMLTYGITESPYVHLPKLALVDAAPQVPFRVHLVPLGGAETVADGTPVHVRLLGVPLDIEAEATSKSGTALFRELAVLGGGLRVSLPGAGPHAAYEIDAETRRLTGEMWIAATPADAEARRVDGGAIESEIVEARVLYPVGHEFGRVPLERRGTDSRGRPAVHLHTVQGPQEWLLRHADGTWSHYLVSPLPRGQKAPATIKRIVVQGKGCHVRGNVPGAMPGSRVTFRLLLGPAHEDASGPTRNEAGGGFSAAVSPQGEYEATLCPGRWAIQVVGPTGGRGASRTMDLGPGTNLRMDLPAR